MMELLTTLAQAGPGAGQTAPIAGHGMMLIWAVVMLAAALALFLIEVFLPTGGLLGFFAGLCAVVGIVLIFRVDTTMGLIAAALILLAAPFLLGFALKILPDTPFYKWITLNSQAAATNDRDDDAPPPPDAITVGIEGRTVSTLRPVGTCLLRGRREECLAKHGTIGPDTPVRVVAVSGSEVYVLPIEG